MIFDSYDAAIDYARAQAKASGEAWHVVVRTDGRFDAISNDSLRSALSVGGRVSPKYSTSEGA